MSVPTNLISASVGMGGANRSDDVKLVQQLLNEVPSGKGGPPPFLDVDGIFGSKTYGAISRFQTVNLGFADGRIDPGMKTEKALLALLALLGLLAKVLGAKPVNPNTPPPPGGTPPGTSPPPGQTKPGGPPPPPQGKPPKGGAKTAIRQRFLAICNQLLPAHGQLTPGGGAGPKGTGCGEFPGRVFARVPVPKPWEPGAFKQKVSVPGYTGNLYLTSPMTAWEQFAKAVDKDHGSETWITFSGNRPLPGDIYVLGQYDNPAKFQHVGVIIDASGSEWTTADGGQGNGWQSGFVKRQFHQDGQIDGEFGNKARLRGWVDLDRIRAVAHSSFPPTV